LSTGIKLILQKTWDQFCQQIVYFGCSRFAVTRTHYTVIVSDTEFFLYDVHCKRCYDVSLSGFSHKTGFSFVWLTIIANNIDQVQAQYLRK